MDLNALRFFLVIAKERHFTRAAQRLQMAQPHLSRTMRNLEKELGFELFDRSNKHQFTLTPAGQFFLDGIARLLPQYEQIVKSAVQMAQREGENVVVGYTPAAMLSNILPQAIVVFENTQQGEVVLRDLSIQSYKGQIQALRELHLDVLLTVRPFDEADITHECLSKVPLLVALPSTHRLAQMEVLSLRALADEKIIHVPRRLYPRLSDDLLALSQQAGFNPREGRTVSHIQSVLSLVASGMGIAFVSAWAMPAFEQQGVVYRRLFDVSYQSELHLLWRKDETSPLVQTFLQIVREVSGLAG
jgi:DNA-binding transcriptional LysR family regulator